MLEFKTAATEIERGDSPIKVESTLFTGQESIRVALQLGRMVLPFLKGLSGIKKITTDEVKKPDEKLSDKGTLDALKQFDVTPDFFKTITDQLILTCDDKKVLELIFRLLKGTRVNGQEIAKPEIFDIVFQGDLGLLLEVLQFVIMSNFESFFKTGSIGALLTKLANAAN